MTGAARSLRLAALILAGVLVLVGPALAHRLKLFATVEGTVISGRAFFVGGGSPGGATVTIRDGAGTVVATVTTDADGAFRWTAPGADAYRLQVDVGDGHGAEASIAAERFAGHSAPVRAPAEPPTVAEPPPGACTGSPTTADLAAMIDDAVARQIRPLLEATVEADARVRFNDVVGGLGAILGIFGTALWVAGRRRPGAPP